MARRIAIVLGLVAALAVLWRVGAFDMLSLDWVKARQADLVTRYRADPLGFAAVFIALHALLLALCVPGAVLVPALAAGAIFGWGIGVAVVLAGLVIGDSAGFLLARTLLRGPAERLMAARGLGLGAAWRQGGPAYLVSLRLLAVVPYFLVNIAMALTAMPLWQFAPLSLIGLVPSTILYVGAGRALATIERASDIYSPAILAAFAALALVPLAIRRLASTRGRRAL